MIAASEPASSASPSWVIDRAGTLTLGLPAGVMGILNVTPDSFSDGGLHADARAAVAAGLRLSAQGARWIDVGGESSRPGAGEVGEAEELARILPVVRGLIAAGCPAPISIDTRRAAVARAALDGGARMVNDISAGADPAMFPLVAERGCPLVLMHMRGTPRTMQVEPRYDDVVAEVVSFLTARIAAAMAAGIPRERLLLDPGIGFGKTLEHNLHLLRALPGIAAATGRPLVVGISRKALIARIVGDPARPAPERDAASHVLHGLIAGQAALLRVHDVAGARDAVAIATACLGGTTGALGDGGGHG